METTIKFIFLISLIHLCWGARILCIFPTPTHGSNNVYKTLANELIHRGYDLVVLTTEPNMYEESEYCTIINLGGTPHKIWAKKYITKDIRRTLRNSYFSYYDVMLEITDEQMKKEEVVKLINSENEKFDLLIVESYIPTWYAFAEKFNIPIVAVSPENPGIQDLENFGVPTHPYLYPDNSIFIKHDTENLGFFERFSLFFDYFSVSRTYNNVYFPRFEMIAKKYFGNQISLKKIQKNINVLLVTMHPILFGIRPTVPGVVFTGNIHAGQHKELPEWLLEFMDSADNGVILFSLGSNVMSQYLPPDKLKIFVEAFAELPYKIIWKWETKNLPGHPGNVLIYDWTVQQDILANLKTMAFVTAGGRQSIDEAIQYQVPMVGIPIFGDHKFNVAKVAELGMGIQLDFNRLTKEGLKKAILDVVTNETYKNRLAEVSGLIEDQPISAVENVIWWVEYTIRHGGAHHLKHKHEYLSPFRYYFLDVISFIVVMVLIVLVALFLGFLRIKRVVFKRRPSSVFSYTDPKKMT